MDSIDIADLKDELDPLIDRLEAGAARHNRVEVVDLLPA